MTIRRPPIGRAYRPQMPPAHSPAQKVFSWQAIAVAAFVLTIVFWLWQWLAYGWAAGSSLFVIPLLTLLSAPIFISATRSERRFDLAGIAATGLALRFFAAFYRMAHGFDSFIYDQQGNRIADSLRHFRFNVDPEAPVPGTGGFRMIAGVVSVFTGANLTAKFLVFAWLGFLASYLFYRAFVTALPSADHHRYALLIFLWPTLLYWPSSIGKDGWMLLTLGIASLGAARILVRRRGGYTLLVAGLLLGSFVRPHVSLMALLAFGVALLISRRESARPGITPSSVAKIAGFVVLIAIGGIVASRAASLLNVNDFSGSSINSALSQTEGQTDQGGSAFSPANPQNPLGYAEATVTILFRPLPIESHGAEQIATSLEGLFLLALLLASWRRLATIFGRLRSEPYVTYAVVYLLMFFFAFGTISNFGILARQRSQALPFVFVLLALYPTNHKATSPDAEQPKALPGR
jgi:hypothetical protein